jgi:hypothetical protein
MGQPVKLSDELVNEARIAGATMQRSIAGQVEFWASLGKAMEAIMNGDGIHRIRKMNTARSLSESLETVNQPLGRARLRAYLESRPFPRFIADPTEARVFIRQDADGTQTRGRVVGRMFQPLLEESETLPQ